MPAPAVHSRTESSEVLGTEDKCRAAALTLQCAARSWFARGEQIERWFARAFTSVSIETASLASQGTRKLISSSVTALLEVLESNSDVVSFCGYNDFPFKGDHAQAKAEREYWLAVSGEKMSVGKLSAEQVSGIKGADGLLIMHVHYDGNHPCPKDPRRPKIGLRPHREVITQINIRHTWHGSGPKFPAPCKDPGGLLHGLMREGYGQAVLQADGGGWAWSEDSEKGRTFAWKLWNQDKRRMGTHSSWPPDVLPPRPSDQRRRVRG